MQRPLLNLTDAWERAFVNRAARHPNEAQTPLTTITPCDCSQWSVEQLPCGFGQLWDDQASQVLQIAKTNKSSARESRTNNCKSKKKTSKNARENACIITIELVAKWRWFSCKSDACWQLDPISLQVLMKTARFCFIQSNIWNKHVTITYVKGDGTRQNTRQSQTEKSTTSKINHAIIFLLQVSANVKPVSVF